MSFGPVTLRDFITNANVAADVNLPWVHSTESSRILEIMQSGKILATTCNVFKGEKLCYLFVGRPAYKSPDVDEPKYWQLPVVFVIRFHDKPPIKRIFPFDSGAFVGRRLPRFLTTFRMDGYEISNDPANIGRVISFFFKTPSRYLHRKAASLDELQEHYNLDARHQEIQALSELYRESLKPDLDDRAAAIEVQISQDIQLASDNLIGIVLPEEYMRVKELANAIRSLTPNVETYSHWPVAKNQYYALIYDAVQKIYKVSGVKI